MVKTHADYTKLARLHTARAELLLLPSPPQPPQQQCQLPSTPTFLLGRCVAARCARTRARAQHVAGGGGGRRRQ